MKTVPEPVTDPNSASGSGEQARVSSRHKNNRCTLLIVGVIVVVAVLAITLGVTLSGRSSSRSSVEGSTSDATEPVSSPTAWEGEDESAVSDAAEKQGLSAAALDELNDIELFRYVGRFKPASSTDVGVRAGTVQHTFDSEGGEGPVCIAGTSYSFVTRDADPSKLLIFFQGGGACWQDFYNCNVLAEMQIAGEDSDASAAGGIWDWDRPDNPFRDHSVVYLPYCDGSAWLGDNDVSDPAFGVSIDFPIVQRRHHRGLRNLSAGMDVALAMFPDATEITVAGHSAGGVGGVLLAPFFVRLLFGNDVDLTVFNDAGPVVENLAVMDDLNMRSSDWGLSAGDFTPSSCADCDVFGQGGVAFINWRLDNDATVRDALYQTDADLSNRFFMRLSSPEDQPVFRDLVVTEHARLHDAHPKRYKQFIVANDTSHGALQSDLLYTQEADGVLLRDWTEQFLESPSSWENIVEDVGL